ncbi:DUF459 domain-containing protein [Methylocystis parvus]|uniref:SGNH/GDSL hydrolase family protein n=1 Tax=Methylocystis parvus TaxID=134 RepID=UPI001FCCAF8D|nr:SGNH family hydrolase [Methylocystis parvus]WBK00733.1 DUF459 domain-containing protein [Methylocystis parvus OBBP]
MSRALALLLLALCGLLAFAPPSFAQDPFADFFGGLFGGGGKRAPVTRPEEPSRVRRIMPHQENRPPTYWRGGEAARSAAPKRAVRRSVEPSPGGGAEPTQERKETEVAANYFVAVMGDTLGILLANGLEETFADKPEIGVLRKSKESSGLVRDDFYDWQKAAREIANGQQKVDVAVVMIGSNDRQALRQGGESSEPFSPRWREIYVARIDAFLATFHEKKIPVIWVGLPVMKNENFSADMGKLDEIFRERVEKSGGVYVDLWDALADEKGQFSAFGPDVNGQIVKLRTADGVHLTDAGALSVAHFVANEIKKLYESRKPAPPQQTQPTAAAPPSGPQLPGQTSTAPANPAAPLVFRSPVKPSTTAAPTLPDRPAIGPVQSLTASPVASGASELARRAPSSPPASGDAQALAHHVFIEGGEPPPRPNRADDDSWRPAVH